MKTPPLPSLSAHTAGLPPNHRPERILQFGEGVFLRGFVDWMIHRLNASGHFDGSVVVVLPRPSNKAARINAQDGLFTLVLRGLVDGEVRESIELIQSIRRAIDPHVDFEGYLACARNPDLRFIVSNTTEAGIACDAGDRLDDRPPASFPGKLTQFLHARFRAFCGSAASGLVILPCELIESNGATLQRCVRETAARWELEPAFLAWLDDHVRFCNTLVDRIVTGYPPDEEAAALFERIGYTDALLNTAEPFHAWVIEAPASLAKELPLPTAGFNVVFTGNYQPYRDRKVRILNGAHTAAVPAAFLAGHDHVKPMLDDPLFAAFLRRSLEEEIIPTLDLPRDDLQAFAAAVLERFANPFVKHALLSIALNSTSKFTARVLPSLRAYADQRGQLPPGLTFSLAALLAFYRGTEIRDGALRGERTGGDAYPIKDRPEVLAFFCDLWSRPGITSAEAAERALRETTLWGGQDLDSIPGLIAAVGRNLDAILQLGAAPALEKLLSDSPNH